MTSRDARLESAALHRSKKYQMTGDGFARRPLTAEPLHQHAPQVPLPRARPSTSASTQASHSFLHAKKNGFAVKLPHPSTSPLRRRRNQKVVDLHNVLSLHGEEAVSAYLRRKLEFAYVMPEEVGFEDESNKIHDVQLEHKLLD